MRIATGLFAALLLAVGAPLLAQEKALLGSSDFYPSPEHPVGWRGDGSGRFPGATPPKVWHRRIAGITSEIAIQATRPNGKPEADSHTMEYFTVKDWLVAGPFPAPDPEKDIDRDFLGGEDDVQPDAGAKAGDTQWKVHRAYEGSQSYRNCNEHTTTHMWVDFVYAFGKLVPPEDPAPKGRSFAQYTNLDKQAAYAHTYLYAPDDCDVNVDMVHRLPAVKMWVNGAPQPLAKSNGRSPISVKIHLNQGWNRLLVKAICGEARTPWRNKYADPKDVLGQTMWRFAIYLRPAGDGPFSYETENIAWMLKLTGRNASQPIVVGDKVFVGSGSADLLCLDKASGKIQWMHTGTYWDAMNAEERAAVKDAAEPLLQELDRSNTELVSLLNSNITTQGLDTDKQAGVDATLAEREKLAKSVHNALASGRKGRLYLNEVSSGNATPASDGKLVYWVVQGSGGYLTSAFDLDGKLVWSRFEYEEATSEHGSHRSPLICDGKLLVRTNQKVMAYDTATGKELWQGPSFRASDGVSGTPIVVQIDGRRALRTSKCLLSLDGEVLSDKGFTTWGCYLPVVEEGVLYNPCTRRYEWAFQATDVSTGANWKLSADALYGSLTDTTAFHYNASPLYVNGLVYQIEMSGILVAIDTAEKKRVYLKWMDGYNFNDRSLYGYCVSPTLAGNNIYLLDEVGYATIIKPGPDGTVVGNNVLQGLSTVPRSAPCKQEVFYAGLYFAGKKMFVHGDEDPLLH